MTGFIWTLPDFIQTLTPDDKVFYANGCSLVYGAELGGKDGLQWASDVTDEYNTYRADNAYPGLIRSKHFSDYKYFNAAKCGASNDRILRTSTDDIFSLLDAGIKPENLFILIGWTNGMRFEIFQRAYEAYTDVIPGAPVGDAFVKQMGELQISNLHSTVSLARKVLHQIVHLQAVLKQHSIDYLFCSSLDIFNEYHEGFADHPTNSFPALHHIDMDKYVGSDTTGKRNEFALSFATQSSQFKVPAGSGKHPLEEGHSNWANTISEFYTNAKA